MNVVIFVSYSHSVDDTPTCHAARRLNWHQLRPTAEPDRAYDTVDMSSTDPSVPDPSVPVATETLVATDRPARYGKQLAGHLGRTATSEWDDVSQRGSVVFADRGRAGLTAEDGGLRMHIQTTAEHVEQLENVLGRHLVRFGSRDELVVTWARSDGSPGTEQRNEE